MHLPLYVAMLATFLTVVAASPQTVSRTNCSAIPIFKHARFVNANKTVDLNKIKSHVAFVHSKISLGFKNYEMNAGSRQTSPLSTFVQKRQHDIPLISSAAQPWSAIISLGNSGHGSKQYRMSLDTASADIFLPDLKCDSTCDGHQRWDSRRSRTAYSLDTECLISYADGSEVSGRLYMVSIFFTGTRFNTPPQPICSVTSYPHAYKSPGFAPDGVMGMAFPSISSYGANTAFQSLVGNGQVTDPVFSFKLLDFIGELYLGGANDALFSGMFTYVPVIRPGFWLVEMDSILVYDLLVIGGGSAIIDTGAIFISGPSSHVGPLQYALGGTLAPRIGDGYYVFPCTLTPLNIALSFGGKSFVIPGTSLNLGEVTTGSGTCMSAIVSRDIMPRMNLWVVGTPFLQHVYSAFDARGDRPQVGFATLASQT